MYNVIFGNWKKFCWSWNLKMIVKIGVSYNKMFKLIGLGNLLWDIWLVKMVWEMILYY